MEGELEAGIWNFSLEESRLDLVNWASPSPVISPRLARVRPSYDLAHPGTNVTAHRPRGNGPAEGPGLCSACSCTRCSISKEASAHV